MSLWMLWVQMSKIRPCDHMMQMAMHIFKIKMATRVRIEFYRFLSQILLEYVVSLSNEVFQNKIYGYVHLIWRQQGITVSIIPIIHP